MVFSSFMDSPLLSFLQVPMFLHKSSIFIHLVLIFGLVLSWSWKAFRKVRNDHLHSLGENYWYYKSVLFSSLALSLYNSVLVCFIYLNSHQNGWTAEKVVALFDSTSRVLGWLLLSVYSHRQFQHSNGVRYPFPLKIWWGVYLAFSCYCLVIDIIQCRESQCVSILVLVSDVVYVISGTFLCSVGFLGKVSRGTSALEEPFLNNHHHVDSSPYSSAGWLSKITFTWVGTLISQGYNKTLELEDLPPLTGKDNVFESYMIFRNYLDSVRERGDKKVSTLQLVKCLIFTTWVDILLTGFLCLFYTLASYVGPYLIQNFVQYLNGKREYKYEGYFLVSTFFIAKLVECFSDTNRRFRLQVVGIRVKTVLMESVYDKSLSLSCQSKQGHTSGEMINFMSVDAKRVGSFSWRMHSLWTVILQLALALVILYRSLGIASIAAFATTVVFMFANYPFSELLTKYQQKLMQSKDTRMKATSEILKNMKILKLYAWELKFLSKIVELRNTEGGWLKKILYTSTVMTSLVWNVPTILSVVTFGTCIILGIPLESGKILSALATFENLQGPIYNLPSTISVIIQTKVSLERIASFLSLDDLLLDTIERLPKGTCETAIEITDGNFSWDPSASSPTLKDINLKVNHGMKVAVCGAIGSGKSTLLSSILGEVSKISGAIKLSGSKAYVSQSPWIQSGKIVDNILFGLEMDCSKYNRVLEACSLKKDLENLSVGDQTIIGERGVNLSGGQKQRVQIARALYQDADIYLLDDPFSAVDAHTCSHLFKECLLGVLESKTVIYVTHQVEFLPAADLILVIKDGRILQAGKYNDMLTSGTDFRELVGAHEQALSTLDSIKGKKIEPTSDEAHKSKTVVSKDNSDDNVGGRTNQLVQEEERDTGRVGFPVYWKYMTATYGGALVPFILLALIIFQVLQILSNYWIVWATPDSSDADPIVDGKTLLVVYVGLSSGSAFCILAMSTLLVIVAYKTANSLFTEMHSCIFRAPMSYLDATPSGRILTRASEDQSVLDLSIPYQLAAFAFSLISLLGIVVMMSQVTWQVFMIFIPITVISLWYQQYYIPSARELRRLIGVSEAPVIQILAETIAGATTIRSFDQESRFCEASLKLINVYTRPLFYNAAMTEWLSIRLDLLSSFTFAASLIFLILVPAEFIDPGIAGLCVIYGLQLNTVQGGLIWTLCGMEKQIISVERILQYSCIESEPPLVIEENRPESSWPSHGEIDIQHLEVRYALHMPLVLRGISCSFQAGKKTGIVGRTGSGKSTLIQTLFRIVEPASGQILLDDINISSIGLHDLRSRLSIIPQDPTMFEGTIRSNLDPLEEYSDELIWEALDKCQLGNEVRDKEGKLESKVKENGENWSVGQRQLLCLGRVLLKKSKVLVLDEATSSVDPATENLMQEILREHFIDSTVIIVAHRIASVINSDSVMVLSDGLVVECDSPSRLLENNSSSFAKLVAEYTRRSI